MNPPASVPSSHAWTASLRNTLLEQAHERGGWGYVADGESFVEPTVLSALALLATSHETPKGSTDRDRASGSKTTRFAEVPAAQRAANWLADIQQSSGALGLSKRVHEPNWPTAYAVLLWNALDGFASARDKAIEWLLACEGEVFPRTENIPVGHDSTIRGWPWTGGTHSWVEPTATAVLALRGAGFGNHARVREGIRLLRDRALAAGGWNFGSKSDFGKLAPPQPSATAWVLLALAGLDETEDLIRPARAYLKRVLPTLRSPRSLATGLLALKACDDRPEAARQWLLDSEPTSRRYANSPVELAWLLLAAGERSLDCFYINGRPTT